MDSKGQDGPQVTKQKPTWTRLNRMECGLKLRETEGSSKSLGKRRIQDAEIEEEIDTGSKVGKRGRLSEDVQMDEAARVHEHPCRAQ